MKHMQLTDAITDHFRLTAVQKSGLKRLNIFTIQDLLYHFPSRYENISGAQHINALSPGADVILYGQINNLQTRKAFRKKTPIAEGVLDDGTGKLKITWFNQPYVAKMIPDGSFVKIVGKVGGTEKSPYLPNPEIERLEQLPVEKGRSLFADGSEHVIYPIYPETRGITSKWFYHVLKRVLTDDLLSQLKDPVPDDILKRYNLPYWRSAFIWIHAPREEKDSTAARKRFAFDEVFFIQLAAGQARKRITESQTISVSINVDDLKEFVSRFPFTITQAQRRAIREIIADFKRRYPMSRLLEGDVGSGKTAVAATTAHAVVTTCPEGQDFGNLQVAYMAPTEILARQHFESFIEYFQHMPINIGLITSSECRKFPSKVNPSQSTHISRTQLLKWVANGEVPILIGTHALIQKSVQFKNLAYVIIDEQHRFGTAQRQRLVRKDKIVPHLLSMTATPIPRTLALTVYGDLDLTLLDEMPVGRKPVITEIVPPHKREDIYVKIHAELALGRQAYVICPRIQNEESETPIEQLSPQKIQALNLKTVTDEAKRLKKEIFPQYEIGVLHSKLKPKDKESIMERFLSGDIQILVATSVVEVGVNVPNATVIIIEGAERFGLAQLHQLRGRVLRSAHQAYCYVFTESRSKKSQERLKALKTAKNGFELAEQDLMLRGAGELYGRRQWGISDIGMEAIKNIRMVEAARHEAQQLVEKDPDFSNSTPLAKEAQKRAETLHFE